MVDSASNRSQRRASHVGGAVSRESFGWTWSSKRLLLFFGFAAMVFLMGGSGRADTTSLVVLRPVAITLLAYGICTLPLEIWRTNKLAIGMCIAIILLPASQLIPLPLAMSGQFSGHEIVAGVSSISGLDATLRPMSLVPPGTWNALYSLAIPAAAFFLLISLGLKERRGLIPFLLMWICFGAILGLLQIIGGKGSMLYFYRITHGDSPVGLLANRNHFAVFVACAFPLLAALASDPDYKRHIFGNPYLIGGISAFLIPLILVTGSRMGLAIALVSIGLSFGLYFFALRSQGIKLGRRNSLILCFGVVLVGALALTTMLFGRAIAVRRVLAWSADSDFRFSAWIDIARFADRFWPWGSGYGSFVDVYKANEPLRLLHTNYFNNAHNDWLELVLTGGLPAMAVLLVFVALLLFRGWQLIKPISTEGSTARRQSMLGIMIIIILALGSITDYPLRAPSMAMTFVIALAWLLPVRRSDSAQSSLEEEQISARHSAELLR